MTGRKTYGQFCGLARALDRVGDRWTLLLIRELLIRPAAFRELQESLSGIAPNLLADRLRDLVADGIVERSDAAIRSKAVRYSLTQLGRELEPAVLELIRWGSTWMTSGPGADEVIPQWGLLALRALLSDRSVTTPPGSLHLHIEGVDLTVVLGTTGRAVTQGPPADARARVCAPLPALLAVASGATPLDADYLTVTGDPAFAASALAPRPRRT